MFIENIKQKKCYVSLDLLDIVKLFISGYKVNIVFLKYARMLNYEGKTGHLKNLQIQPCLDNLVTYRRGFYYLKLNVNLSDIENGRMLKISMFVNLKLGQNCYSQ